MKNKPLIYVLLCLLPNLIFSQGEKDWWYFGFNAGVHFVSNVPIPLSNGKVNTKEGCATISNLNGDLLFYTDGITVWTKNHTVMPNGTGLKGDPSSTMSSMCIPLPGSTNQYYIFTTPAKAEDGLYYSIVDLSLNNGLGEIVSGKKNVMLMDRTCEKVTAVKNTNNTGYWILAHSFPGNEYHAYQLTSTGLNASAVISAIGVSLPSTNTSTSIGYMKFSPLGNKLAVAHTFAANGLLEVFDFNANTGILSPDFAIAGNGFNAYGIEFSANGQYLYVSTLSSPYKVFQLDMFTPPNQTVAKTLIHTDSTHQLGSLQIGPNDKIYVAVKDDSTLDVINTPILGGTACNYQKAAVNLGTDAYLSLPNFVQGLFIPPNLSGNTVCMGNTIVLSGAAVPNGTSYQWAGPNSFFLQQITATISGASVADAGDYYFSAFDANGILLFNDTVTITVNPTYQVNVQDTFCRGGTYILPDGTSTTQPGYYDVLLMSSQGCDSLVKVDLYQTPAPVYMLNDTFCQGGTYLLPNGTSVENAGFYTVELNPINGCTDIYQVNLYQRPAPVSIVNDTFCQGTTYILPNGTSVNVAGNYPVTISTPQGCDSLVTTQLYMRPAPNLTLGADKTICEGTNTTFSAPNGFVSYIWNGNTNQNQSVFVAAQMGQYWVQAQNAEGCWASDTVEIVGFYPKPQHFLPQDSFLCNNNTGEQIFVKINGFLSYLWGNGSTQNSLSIQDTGNYYLTVENNFHCFGTDTFHVKQACPLEIYFPNAFTPNRDGNNDIFSVIGQGIDFLELHIFDAWGRLIVTLHSPQEVWDGTHQGKDAPEGVYTFKVEAASILGQKLKRGGTITLIR